MKMIDLIKLCARLASECVHVFYHRFNEAVVEAAEMPSFGLKFVYSLYHIII